MDFIKANYSVTFIGEKVEKQTLEDLLARGIKVLVFGKPVDAGAWIEKNNNEDFHYYENACDYCMTIVDGQNVDSGILKELGEANPKFNAEQYSIEHMPIDKNIIVKAGAGTGKTTVMIERLLFLMHIDKDFDFSKVVLITFTNEATNNIRQKLIERLRNKYFVSKNEKYIRWIEESSQIRISTIHSFFKELITEISPAFGYSKRLQIRGFVKEKNDLIEHIIDTEIHKNGQKVQTELGVELYKIKNLVRRFWSDFSNKGITDEDIEKIDWGDTEDESSRKIQDTVKFIISNIGKEYAQLKIQNDAISMDDIIKDIGLAFNSGKGLEYIQTEINYLFCDEFQDSDNVQIKTIAALVASFGAKYFVVGDIKQSIYRFRGATDSAFDRLTSWLDEYNIPQAEAVCLMKNYRTSRIILDTIQPIFEHWAQDRRRLLERPISLRPMIEEPGVYEQVPIVEGKKKSRTQARIKSELISKVKMLKEESDINEIVCLTRNNWELNKIDEWCQEERIVSKIEKKGAFYQSKAVLEFKRLIECILYHEEPIFLFNYTQSAYYHGKEIDLNIFSTYQGDVNTIRNQLKEIIKATHPNIFDYDFINEPAVAVLRKVVSEADTLSVYYSKRFKELRKKGYSQEDAKTQAEIDANRYQANLQKLLRLLLEKYGNEMTSLLDIYRFLSINVMTNKEEDEERNEEASNDFVVRGMTVHSAKGLQFDTVIIPFMNDSFFSETRTELFLSSDDPIKVGWRYVVGKETFTNKYYNTDSLRNDEKNEVFKEEARLLYVAMTRAKQRLYCFPIQSSDNYGTWSEYLPQNRNHQ